MLLSIQTPPLWRVQQTKNFTDWKKLADFLELEPAYQEKILTKSHFPLNLPLRLAKKIQKNTLDDPILKQFLPTKEETLVTEGYLLDPVGDQLSRKCAKLLHKYHGRALLITTSACAMHCRYCFRRNFDYDVQHKGFAEELKRIKEDSSIEEIILSGGDPLSLSNSILKNLLEAIDQIPHIKIIRFHSRFLIGIPERIDEEFLQILSSISKQIVFVIHTNHASEFDTEIIASIQKMQNLRIPILSQSVLLKGVNDNLQTMKILLQKLIHLGIIPYYLHQMDKAQGTSHFETDEISGIQLIEELTKILPGYAIPKYVRETSGEPCKTRII